MQFIPLFLGRFVCLGSVVVVVVVGNTTRRDAWPWFNGGTVLCVVVCYCSNNDALECEHIMMKIT